MGPLDFGRGYTVACLIAFVIVLSAAGCLGALILWLSQHLQCVAA